MQFYTGIKQAGVKKEKKETKKQSEIYKKKNNYNFFRANSCIKTTTLPVPEGWGGNDMIELSVILFLKSLSSGRYAAC